MSLPLSPVEALLPDVRQALREGRQVVLQASPGAGKTTRIPPALLHEPWLDGQGMILLEPRRIAARMCASFMAGRRGERLGETIGYCVRLERLVSARTRIEVVTEGVLTRRLQEDPGLEGIGLVLFDEFHERSLHADLGLALVLDAQRQIRPDLRLLIMSATLDGEKIARLLPRPCLLSLEVPCFPVEVKYLGTPRSGRGEEDWERAIEKALREESGDILVFLPGEREIHRLERRLEERYPAGSLAIRPLYGRLPLPQQQSALQPCPQGVRRVVLSTPVAETSLTIEGIRTVIDSGRQRIPLLDRNSGLTRLATVRIAQSSAEQRRGRAGRTAPGVCYRLWSEMEHRHLKPHALPEIRSADLAGLALELALWGVRHPAELCWADVPPEESWQSALGLLRSLEAVDPAGRITGHGRRMARLGTHPRLAHMMLRAAERGMGPTGCALAALLGEREVLGKGDGEADPDIRSRLELFESESVRDSPGRASGTIHALRQTAWRWQRMLAVPAGQVLPQEAGRVLAFAYPERIAQRRAGRTAEYLLRGGQGALLPGAGTLSGSEFIVAASLEAGAESARIFLAAPLSREDLLEQFGPHMTEERAVAWDADLQAVRATRRQMLGRLVVRTAPLEDLSGEERQAAWLEAVRREGLRWLPWSEAADRWLARVRFVQGIPEEEGRWPDFSEERLMASLEDWLGPWLAGIRRIEELRRLDLEAILASRLDRWQSRRLEELAPTHLSVPSGSRLRVEYPAEGPPVLAVRIQEMFGCTETPQVGGGRIPVLLHLLSPAGRPAQITRDLAGFWRSGYRAVRKELLGRYPRHPWPENPLEASPTRHTKKKSASGAVRRA